LKRGDVIRAVDGTPVTCHRSAASLIESRPVRSRVTLTISRKGQMRDISLRTASYQGQPVVGVHVAESYTFPFKVTINIGNVGGPSAGLMFALGIIDKITPVNLTGGKFIAGTGEIQANGTVLPIGGIQQKMAAARAAGATVFLAPAGNCRDTAGAGPAGVGGGKGSSVRGGIQGLGVVQAGQGAPGRASVVA